MLTPDDAAVAGRHATLPGLRVILDPAAVTEEIARALPALGVVAAQATYVRFKPPTSCLVGYRLILNDGDDVDAYVRTTASVDDPKLKKAVAAARLRSGGSTTAALLDPCTAVLVHPSDHDLPALARLAHPEQRRHILARALDAAPTDGWQLQRLRYKPERRWVGRLTDMAGTHLLLKVHRAAQHAAVVAGAAAFRRAQAPVSELVGSSRRHGLTIHQWVDGSTAADVLSTDSPDADAVPSTVGALLAQLHSLGPDAARTSSQPLGTRPGEGHALAAGVAAIAALEPDAGIRAERIAGHIADQIGGRPGSIRLLHGDCSFDQVIIGAHGPVLIDVDRATSGDPHSDLGQLLADLTLLQVTGALTDDRPIAAAVLASYTAAGGRIDPERLAVFTAARLLRVAPEPFRRRRDCWAAELSEVVRRTADLTRDGLSL